MHGDFSRDSYDPTNDFTQVLMQQGRLIVDADWNEQSTMLLNYLRTMAADIIGWHGGPNVAPGLGKVYNSPPTGTGPFLVTLSSNEIKDVSTIGNYYVDGILLNHGAQLQKLENGPDDVLKNRVLFLDIWERQVIAASDDVAKPDNPRKPGLRDPALEGLDTTTRVKRMCWIRVFYTDLAANSDDLKRDDAFRRVPIRKNKQDADGTLINLRQRGETHLPQLIAWTNLQSDTEEDCDESVAAGYTGLENQLYRVEIHRTGPLWDGGTETRTHAMTVKWSRDNGSITYAGTVGANSVTLKSSWRDETRAIQAGDWVELILEPASQGNLVQVKDVMKDSGPPVLLFSVTPSLTGDILVRRWDHRAHEDDPLDDGGILIRPANGEPTMSSDIVLEDGLSCSLQVPDGSVAQAGDYWLIPARAATSDIVWPRDPTKAGRDSYSPVNARYTRHHYAPIAHIDDQDQITDLRRLIKALGDNPT